MVAHRRNLDGRGRVAGVGRLMHRRPRRQRQRGRGQQRVPTAKPVHNSIGERGKLIALEPSGPFERLTILALPLKDDHASLFERYEKVPCRSLFH